jgi:capsular polysaccharide biosynthesis protein
MLLFSLITEHTLWLLIPCIGIAFLYTWFFYRKDNSIEEIPRFLKYLIRAFRFIVVLVLAFFLLSPMFRYFSTNVQKPILVFAVDNSKSVVMANDSVYYKTQFVKQYTDIIKSFSDNYEIVKVNFGDKARSSDSINFEDKRTDFSKLFDYIQATCSNKNVGAIVVASDGLYNSGINPLYIQTGINSPLYTIVLGDTTPRKDIRIEDVIFNKVVFKGNSFSIKLLIKSDKCKGENLQVNVTHNKNIIANYQNLIKTDEFTDEILFEIKADQPGLQHYLISVTPKTGEITTVNNYRDIVVEVLDSKQKVLLLVNSPHPDAGALRSALETNPNFEITYAVASDFKGNVTDYNLIILHQLPSKTNAATQIIQNAINSKVPILFSVGSQTLLSAFNRISTGLQINQTSQKYDEAYPFVNNSFVQFQFPQNLQDAIKDYPPLNVPFGDYKVNAGGYVLFQQRIKSISTSKPLVLFFDNFNDSRVGIICGEGYWRWRLKDYFNNSNHDAFNEIINKTIQYLTLKVKKEKFNVTYKNIYFENEPLLFGAELYNDNFEPVNESDVIFDITNSDKKKFSYTFSKTGQFYSLNAGTFPPGDFAFVASTQLGDKKYSKSGKFVVASVNIESAKLVANKKLMEQLAVKNNGKCYDINSMNSLIDEITKNKNIVSISYTEKKLAELINFKILFFSLVLLLSFEWFIRKYFGSY